MDKILIWGTASKAQKNYKIAMDSGIFNNKKIIAFVDKDSSKWGKTMEGFTVIPPSEILNISYDYICIWSTYKQDILKQLKEEFNISPEKARHSQSPN